MPDEDIMDNIETNIYRDLYITLRSLYNDKHLYVENSHCIQHYFYICVITHIAECSTTMTTTILIVPYGAYHIIIKPWKKYLPITNQRHYVVI